MRRAVRAALITAGLSGSGGWSAPKPGHPCADCERPTVHEQQFMVRGHVWAAAGMDAGHLCIDCLERRLRRTATRRDFTHAPINYVRPASPRLAARMRTPGRPRRPRRRVRPSQRYAPSVSLLSVWEAAIIDGRGGGPR